MEQTPTVTILALALLTVPAFASGATSSTDGPPSVWIPEDKVLGSTPAAHLGSEVSIHGDTAVATAPGTDQVFVYDRARLGWAQTDVLSTDAPSDDFGWSVAVDDGTLVVGARSSDAGPGSFAGAVHVYEQTADGWTQEALLTADDASDSIHFGQSVDVRDDSIAVGASSADASNVEGAGAVYLFEAIETGWSQAEKLTAPNPESGDSLGISVALSDNAVLSGNTQGEAHVFEEGSSGWQHEQTLTSPNAFGFGRSLDLAASTIAVGAPWSNTVTIYRDSPDGWTKETVLESSDLSPTDIESAFGRSVSLSHDGSRLLIGAPDDDRSPAAEAGPTVPVPCLGLAVTGTCSRAGAVYSFHDRTETGWELETKIVAPEGAPSDMFGKDVALDASGMAGIVGAPEDDFAPGDGAGSAYVLAQASKRGTIEGDV